MTEIIRPYESRDAAAIQGMFEAHGFAYGLPDPQAHDMLASLVLENGAVRTAALLRLEVNAFLLMDNNWSTPQHRWEALQSIHESMRRRAESAGIEQANAWIPQEIEKQFAPRLAELGWRKNVWNSYSRKVKE